MLARAVAWIRAQEPGAQIELSVNPRQIAALHLYERFGFVRTGHREPLEHTPGEEIVEMRLAPPSAARSVGEGHGA